jgi:hypothetical protein
MLNKMPIIAYNVPEENRYIKPNMAMMRLNVFPSYKNSNSNSNIAPQINSYNNNNNMSTSSGIRSISIRSILGAPRTGCSSCRGG